MYIGCLLFTLNVAEMTGQHMVDHCKCKKWYLHTIPFCVCKEVAPNSMNSIANAELMVYMHKALESFLAVLHGRDQLILILILTCQ